MSHELPLAFLQTISKQLPEEINAFQETLSGTAPTSIRYNPFKPIARQENEEAVKWNKAGIYLEERPVFTLDPVFHAGAYYVQEASSMFVAEVLRQSVDCSQPLKVLDLCAAPGGKSTLLLSELSKDSLLVANEVIKARYKVLKENLMKWGTPNIAICQHDPSDLAGLEGFFDVLLIDAPCSGEGLFRKDEKAIQEWSPDHVQLCSARQKRIFKDAITLLKKGGILIYCTCTYNEAENLDNVVWLSQQFSVQSLQLQLEADWHIVEKVRENQFGYQFYPHKLKGEGFFISVLKKLDGITYSPPKSKGKKNQDTFRSLTKLPKKQLDLLAKWIHEPNNFLFYLTPNEQVLAFHKHLLSEYLTLDKVLKIKQFGIPIGVFKRDDFLPAHDLALSTIIHPNLPAIAVDRQTALQFLKKENIAFPSAQKGWQLIRFEGLNLGWIKAVPGRINNYLPKEFRIRMEIE